MSELEELETALRQTFATTEPPTGFSSRVMKRIASNHEPVSPSAPFREPTHFAWIVSPKQNPSQLLPRWKKRLTNPLSFSEKQSIGLFETSREETSRCPWLPITSIALHASAAMLLFVGFTHRQTLTPKKFFDPLRASDIDIRLPLPVQKQTQGGGGGGGAQQKLPLSQGSLPQVQKPPLLFEQLHREVSPKLSAEPSVVLPKMQELNTQFPDVGLPNQRVVTLAEGSGSSGGLGSGVGGGIGSGKGIGIGPGSGGGMGRGSYRVGIGGVSAPVVLKAVDPEFSEEARRAKYQGVCTVSLIVDAEGRPQNIRVLRKLGMGLDEKAMEAVKQYRFRPAMLQGKPVPTQIAVEVNFRIY